MKKYNKYIISTFFVFTLLIFCQIIINQKDRTILETFQKENDIK